jgi:osmotically inducible lipoprotein OsmB
VEDVAANWKTMMLVFGVGALGLLTAACGERPVDRALTGGAIGAASGAVVGSTVGSPVTGAVVGGAAGATIGAVTAPQR